MKKDQEILENVENQVFDNTEEIQNEEANLIENNNVDDKKLEGQIKYNNDIHKFGRIFTLIALGLMCFVPIFTAISVKSGPDWGRLAKTIPFTLGFLAIGLIEAFSYAPLLGVGGQYLSFITGNISNLKLPCAINAQQVAKVEQGTEEHEIITTIAIAVSSIVTTLIIIIGLIPLAIYQQKIVEVLKPISPYVMPAIFGALTMVLIAVYWKNSIAPFLLCCVVAIIMHSIGMGGTASISTMVMVGMVFSIVSNYIIYNREKIKDKLVTKFGKNKSKHKDDVTADSSEDTELEKAEVKADASEDFEVEKGEAKADVSEEAKVEDEIKE